MAKGTHFWRVGNIFCQISDEISKIEIEIIYN